MLESTRKEDLKMDELKERLLNDIEETKNLIREVNSWNMRLEYLDYWDNSDWFFEECFSTKNEVARAICYGNYNYMDELVRFNAYGNLESCSEYEYEEEIKDYIGEIAQVIIEEKDNIEFNNKEIENLCLQLA